MKLTKTLLLFLPLLIAACGDGEHLAVGESLPNSSTSPGTTLGSSQETNTELLNFDQHVRPIFQAKCSACHKGGALADWTNYEVAKLNLDKIKSRVFVIADMPRVGQLSHKEKSILETWIKAGGASSFPTQGEQSPIPGPTPPVEPGPEPEPGPGPAPEPTPTPVFKSPGEKTIKTRCWNCHGQVSLESRIPFLHGQGKSYVQNQLAAFKSGQRPDLIFMGVMNTMAQGLSESDISEVADYLQNQNPCVDARSVDSLGGDIELGRQKSVSCTGCHTAGNGIGAPLLGGQNPYYLQRTLKAFKDGQRTNPIMNGMAASLTEDDIKNLASYFYSLVPSGSGPCVEQGD